MSLHSTLRWIAASTLVLAACAHEPPVQEFSDTANPSEEVAKLSSDIDQGHADQLNVLSPRHFQAASEKYMDAKASLDHGRSPRETLHQVALARAHLDMARHAAETAQDAMAEVSAARSRAMRAQAPRYYAKDFKKADDDLRDVTQDIENGSREEAAQQRASLQARYLDLELKAIKQANLGNARQIIDRARDEGAEKVAPVSLARAEKAWKDAEAYITANLDEDAEVARRSDIANQEADKLLKITRLAKEGKSGSAESIALRLDQEEREAQQAQKGLERSREELASQDRVIHEQNAAITQEQMRASAIYAQKQQLEADRAANEAYESRFEKARALFAEDEAEVYRQGDKLLIRLKGLEFPKAQATLKGSNYALLQKVESVIKDFSPDQVTIEGHTDSSGGKALNQRLSEKRAQAVKDYLASNAPEKDIDFRAVGFGFQRPLATNKTASGRAQNRRVDVVLEANSKADTSSGTKTSPQTEQNP